MDLLYVCYNSDDFTPLTLPDSFRVLYIQLQKTDEHQLNTNSIQRMVWYQILMNKTLKITKSLDPQSRLDEISQDVTTTSSMIRRNAIEKIIISYTTRMKWSPITIHEIIKSQKIPISKMIPHITSIAQQIGFSSIQISQSEVGSALQRMRLAKITFPQGKMTATFRMK